MLCNIELIRQKWSDASKLEDILPLVSSIFPAFNKCFSLLFVPSYYSLCAPQLPHYFDLFNKSFKVLIILFLSVSVNSYSLNKLTISSSPSSRPFKISKDVPNISANFSTVSSFGFLPPFSHPSVLGLSYT